MANFSNEGLMDRNLAYDSLRIFACLLIICMHAPMPTCESNAIIVNSISYLSSPAIGLFFMISGALLLPVQGETLPFLKKRVCKLAWPALVWSFLYMLVHYLKNDKTPTIKEILSIPFSPQGSTILWFLYAMIGLYLVAPVISPWLERIDYKTAKLYLYIFLIAFCVPIVSQFLFVDTRPEGMLYYFIGYIGYFYAGWFLTKYPNSISLLQASIGMAISILAVIVCKLWCPDIDFYQVFWYKSIFVLMMAVFWFKLFSSFAPWFEKMPQRIKDTMVLISNLSFGIYLVHFMIIRQYLWDQVWIKNIDLYLVQTTIIIVITFIISIVISFILSKTPIGKYMIGCSK